MYPESLPNCGCPDNTTPPVEAPAPPVCENGELCEEVINTQCVRYDGPNIGNGITNEMNMTSIVQILSGISPTSVVNPILKYVATIGIIPSDSPGGIIRVFQKFELENSVGSVIWNWVSTGEYEGTFPSGIDCGFLHAHISGATALYNLQVGGFTVLPIVDNNYISGVTTHSFLRGYIKIYFTYGVSSWKLVVNVVDTNNVLTDIDTLGINLLNLPEIKIYT